MSETAIGYSDIPHAGIVAAIVAEGSYVLSSPAHFGGGESDEVDMALARHANGNPFIPGSTLAGVARTALNCRLLGWTNYRNRLNEPQAIGQVFGGLNGNQSALLVDDAEVEIPNREVSALYSYSIIRDGVAINSNSGVAEDNHKFDREVLPMGVSFKLRFELQLRKGHGDHSAMRRLFYTLLYKFKNSEWPLRVGAATHRGYGLGAVDSWKVREADFSKSSDVAWWLLDRIPVDEPTSDVWTDLFPDLRTWFRIKADLNIKSSVLVGSYPKASGEPDKTPVRNGIESGQAVIPGTALAGVCRHRAERIINTLTQNYSRINQENRAKNPTDESTPYTGLQVHEIEDTEQPSLPPYELNVDESLFTISKSNDALPIVRYLFGPDPEELRRILRNRKNRQPVDSRVIFDEAIISDGVEEIQSRIHIDPFTGGVYEGPFDEQAIWSGDAMANIELDVRIPDPQEAEIGLMLLILKDMWLEDLPLGGGTGIGRGVLIGDRAEIYYRLADGSKQEFIVQRKDSVASNGRIDPRVNLLPADKRAILEGYVKTLNSELEQGKWK